MYARGVATSLGPVDPVEVIEGLMEGLQIVDRQWRYRYLNAAACRHGRMPREALVGRTMMECYPGIEGTPLFAVLAECMATRSPATFDNQFTYPDGRDAWFELRIGPWHDDGLVVLSIDITERKRLEAALRTSYQLRALGQMAAGVAHDLGNLLNPIALELARLRRRVAADPDALAAVERAGAVVARGAETVTRLRDYARPTERPAAAVDLDAVAREAASLVRASAPWAPGRVVQLIEELGAPPPAPGHGPDLLAALVNLLINAVDAVGDGGRVVVRTGAADDMVWVAIEDDGVGMSPEVVARAHEPYFTTKGSAGTGLGLAMVHAAVVRAAGAMDIRSAVGVGTTITLRFPRG